MKSIILKLVVIMFVLLGAIQCLWFIARSLFLTGSFIGCFTSGAIIIAGISSIVTLISIIWSKIKD